MSTYVNLAVPSSSVYWHSEDVVLQYEHVGRTLSHLTLRMRHVWQAFFRRGGSLLWVSSWVSLSIARFDGTVVADPGLVDMLGNSERGIRRRTPRSRDIHDAGAEPHDSAAFAHAYLQHDGVDCHGKLNLPRHYHQPSSNQQSNVQVSISNGFPNR